MAFKRPFNAAELAILRHESGLPTADPLNVLNSVSNSSAYFPNLPQSIVRRFPSSFQDERAAWKRSQKKRPPERNVTSKWPPACSKSYTPRIPSPFSDVSDMCGSVNKLNYEHLVRRRSA